MFEYLLKSVEAIGCSLDGGVSSQIDNQPRRHHVSISSVSSIDYEPLVAHLVKHLTVEKQKKVILVHFDEPLGCVSSLLKHIGCQPDALIKAGQLTTINLSAEGLDWQNVELPFVNKPTAVWKEGSATIERSNAGQNPAKRVRAIVGGLKELICQREADVLIVTGLESYAMTVSQNESKGFLRAVEDCFAELLASTGKESAADLKLSKLSVMFAHNRDMFDTGFTSVFESLGQLCHVKLFLAPNEGGFTKSITGQVFISGQEANQNIHYKRVSFRTHNKGMDFFETVSGV